MKNKVFIYTSDNQFDIAKKVEEYYNEYNVLKIKFSTCYETNPHFSGSRNGINYSVLIIYN